MTEIPLEELKSEKCLRISGEDLLDLLGVRIAQPLGDVSGAEGSNKALAAMQAVQRTFDPSKSRVIVLDIRPADEFAHGALPLALNVPRQTAFVPTSELSASESGSIGETGSGSAKGTPPPVLVQAPTNAGAQQLSGRAASAQAETSTVRSAIDADGVEFTMLDAELLALLLRRRSLIKVVVGSNTKHESDFSNRLLLLGVHRLCFLHRGLEPFKHSPYLIVSESI